MKIMEDRQITITGIETRAVNESTVYTLVAGTDKYQFWSKKKDGSDTKAFEQFQQLGIKQGDTVNVAVEIKQETFINKEQKEITFDRRTILFFKSEENTQAHQSQVPHSDAAMQIMQSNMDNMEARISALEEYTGQVKKEGKTDDLPIIQTDTPKVSDVPF